LIECDNKKTTTTSLQEMGSKVPSALYVAEVLVPVLAKPELSAQTVRRKDHLVELAAILDQSFATQPSVQEEQNQET
jgi:hypothetical protein